MAGVDIDGNTASVRLPPSVSVIKFTAKANSPTTQYLTITHDGKKIHEVSGKGERNALLADIELQGSEKPYTLKYEFDDGGKRKPSELNSGGPYSIGPTNLMVVVAETGDDSDFNDLVTDFRWMQ